MSNELDKLAAEMRKMKASKQSRDTAMDAAMAAFNQEFSAETTAQSEKISSTSQGSTAELRPTGQNIRNGRVLTFGRDAMAKLNSLFNMKPQTLMMAGTCSAALIAGLIVLPNMTDYSAKDIPLPVVPVAEAPIGNSDAAVRVEPLAPKDVAEADEIVVTGKKTDAPKRTIERTFPTKTSTITKRVENKDGSFDIVTEPVEVAPAQTEIVPEAPPGNPMPQGGITSVDSLISDVRRKTPQLEAESRPRAQTGLRFQATPAFVSPPPPPQIERRSVSTATGGSYTTAAVPSTHTEKFGNLTLEQAPAEFKTVTETIVTQEASTELVTIPATYETVMETIVVQEPSKELKVIPPKYEWVEGDIEGSAIEMKAKAAQYQTVSETVVVQEASVELVTIPPTYETVVETRVVQPEYVAPDGSIVPPVTKQISRRVVKTPASTQERTIPAVTKTETKRIVKTPATVVETVVPYQKRNGKTRVPVQPASVVERVVPAVTKTVSRRVIKTPARTVERVKPSVPQTYERQVLVSPPKFYLRDDDGVVVREFASRDAFEIYKANIPKVVEEEPVSTFSVDVDTASYAFLRASINRGQLPPTSAIRLEEMINYFPYDYEAPRSADTPFKANVTVTPNPWNADTKLMHIGIKGYVPPADERPNSNIVLLIDTSGSMRAQNKLPLLINSFKLLLNTLDEDDTVSIVTYAGSAGTVLEPTPANEKNKIKAALENLRSGGSTAGAAGLELAYNKALESFDKDGVNRVILATDGDFNVGFSSPDEMKTYVDKKRETGVFLSVLGFGMGNYNDHLMQSLAQNGNGVAAYIDTLSEANKVLANEAGSALFTIAKDVKIQVEFNPSTVAEYRLIGYETRALKRQDFNNDKVDAGEIGAGHSVTAIYEMTPVGSPAVTVDKLRYVSEDDKPKDTGSDEFAFVKIRHKLPNADKSTLQTFPIGKRQEQSLKRASDDMRFATAVAAVGQKLRVDVQLDDYSYKDAIKLANAAKGEDENGYRAEFVQMVKLIEAMDK